MLDGGRGDPTSLFEDDRSELPQEPHVVLIQQPDVVDLVSPHAKPLNAQPEGKAGHVFRIIAHRAQHIRVDHTGPSHLDPTLAAVPEHVDFNARLGEGEERRTEADFHVPAQIALGKEPEH